MPHLTHYHYLVSTISKVGPMIAIGRTQAHLFIPLQIVCSHKTYHVKMFGISYLTLFHIQQPHKLKCEKNCHHMNTTLFECLPQGYEHGLVNIATLKKTIFFLSSQSELLVFKKFCHLTSQYGQMVAKTPYLDKMEKKNTAQNPKPYSQTRREEYFP